MNRLLSGVTLSLLLMTGTALAQGMPTPEEIDRRIEDALDQLPDTTAEVDESAKDLGITITYKQIPTDPVEVVKQMPNLPPQVASNPGMIKSYLPQAMPYLEKHLKQIGQLSCEHDLKIGSTLVPAGDYDFGLLMTKGRYQPQGFIVQGEPLEKPVLIGLKTKKTKDDFATMELKQLAKGSKVYLVMGWAQTISQSSAIRVDK